MSSVFYRFGAAKDESKITFDGTHISVFDVKRQILVANKMGNGKDFDLGVFDNVTGEELRDDNHQIPRSSSLIVKRLPAHAGKGRGTAQNYIVGTSNADQVGDHRIEASAKEEMRLKMARGQANGRGGFQSLTKRFDGKEDKKVGGPEPTVEVSTGSAEEDARIKAMFAQNADQWEAMQEDMSMQTRAPQTSNYRGGSNAARGGRPGAPPPQQQQKNFSLPPDREPPVGYICYRCGNKGHWIQDCPTNEDPAAQDRKRFVRVTGIPRSFLQTTSAPEAGEGSSAGVMLTADGGFVKAAPDSATWKKQVAARAKVLTRADVRDRTPADQSLACPICSKLIQDAVRTPCCQTAYCEECIQTALLERDFECPNCESKVASLDKVTEDAELRLRIKAYIEEEIEKSKREASPGGGHHDLPEDGVKTEEGDGQKSPSKTAAADPAAEAMANNPAFVEMQRIMMQMQTLQMQLEQCMMMQQNPQLPPAARVQLNGQIQVINTQIMQLQFMFATNYGPGSNMMGMQNMNAGTAMRGRGGAVAGRGGFQGHQVGNGVATSNRAVKRGAEETAMGAQKQQRTFHE